MLVEKFWNASTERLNQVNAAIDASNFYFNMLEIFQMYFTFPSFKNIATQRSFNEIIHFPLHCLKSTFSFQKSCRKSEKWFWGDLCNCPSEILQKDRKNDFGVIFSIFRKNFKIHFSLQKSCRKSEKMIFGRFFHFSANFPKPIFFLQKSCRKSEKMIFGRFFQFSANFPKSIFFLQKSCRKSEKTIFGRFSQFSAKFSKSIFSL